MDIIDFFIANMKNIISMFAMLGIVIDLTPAIKINPVKAILKWIGKQINKEMLDRINKLETKVDENEKDRIRHEIYTFANNMRNNKRKYTAEEFKHIFDINEKYRSMGGNGRVKVEMKYIQEKYFELGGM